MTARKTPATAPSTEAPATDTVAQHTAPAKTAWDLHRADGGYERTYSLADHGPDAEKLAHQRAGKIGGTIR